MLRRALTMAILLGIASTAEPAKAGATPTFSATIVIGDGTVRKVTRDHVRSRHGFHKSSDRHSFDRHRGFSRHSDFRRHKSFDRHHRYGKRDFGGKGFGTRVIVVPAFGRSLHRHLPARPLIRNGSFARRSFHWRPYR